MPYYSPDTGNQLTSIETDSDGLNLRDPVTGDRYSTCDLSNLDEPPSTDDPCKTPQEQADSEAPPQSA